MSDELKQSESSGSFLSIWTYLVSFFGEVEGSIQQYLNFAELSRVVIAALAAGGGVWGFLAYLQAHFAGIINDPTLSATLQNLLNLIVAKNYVGLAVLVSTFILEIYRRFHQGPPLVQFVQMHRQDFIVPDRPVIR